jgi:ATP-dependent Lon protease
MPRHKEWSMETRSLVPHQSCSFQLPIANVRSVFRTHDVERKLAKLPGRDHENLRTTYERMLERGPERFQVKPSGIPDMAELYEQLPNFIDALDDVRRHVALSQGSRCCCWARRVSARRTLRASSRIYWAPA